ncbi:site-2 protease family protein [Actinophytocola sp. NPDC049390]|uniref:site-2 protease family protein n=1 Tax=Actinophytocola sp. NPDC049390 TaxID=3363894 RepID=UPI0037B4232D
MKATLRLGRIAGVVVGLHWSVLGIVVLLLVSLLARLPVDFPAYGTTAYVVAAVLTVVLFVLSLLAHELAHAVVARRNRVEVDGITLWLLGGAARLRGDAPSPGAEFRIAVVGPLASLLVAGLFVVMTWLTAWFDGGLMWVQVLLYLAAVNAVLAVFNLVPAAPLDGGRVLRAVLWAWRGDRVRATVWAARAGRVFGFLLVAGGVLAAVRGFSSGLWWVLLGLFVVTMAGAEEQRARAGTTLGGLRVRDVMTPDPDTAPGDRGVAEFLVDTALARRHSAYPLLDDTGRIAGLVTLNRLRAVPPDRRSTTVLRQTACPPGAVPTAAPDEPLTALLPRLGGGADGRALVLDGERLVGIVTPSDITRAVALRGLDVEPGAAGADPGHADRS